MRISSKGRYGLASMLCLAEAYPKGECLPIITIAERLEISKIYLEQVFSLLKRSGLVSSMKGPQGGYQLARAPHSITALDILSAIELSLFEKTEPSVGKSSQEIELAMETLVWSPLDSAVQNALQAVTLDDLGNRVQQELGGGFMFYI